MSVRSVIKRFVEVYNQPGSQVFPLYGEEVDWIEMPSGRTGGREALFAALRHARELFTGLHLDVLSIVADECEGVLESALTLTSVKDGSVLKFRTLWFFGIRDGLIVKEHDYSFAIK